MGKKNKKRAISTNEWIDIINSHLFVRMRKDNMPNPAMAFYQYAAEKISSGNDNPSERVPFRRIKVKMTSRCRRWKQRSWKKIKNAKV